MTGEEMEKAITFILNQQAQFAANQGKVEERVARLEEAQETTARQIGRLGEALIELTEAHTRTEGSLAQLAEAQAHSDRRLDALVDIVRGMRGGQG